MSTTTDTRAIYDLTHRQVTRTEPGRQMAHWLWQDWGGYVGQLSWATRHQIDALAEAAGLGPGRAGLDLCCGTGGIAAYLQRSTGCRLVGMDYSAPAVDIARTDAAGSGQQDQLRFDEGDARELPYPDESFDSVLCVDSLVIVPQRGRILRECFRVLRPGGVLAFSDEVVRGTLPRDPELLRALNVYGTLYPETPLSYRRLAEHTGFTDVRVEDSTESFVAINDRWAGAYRRYEAGLREVLGEQLFDDGLGFFEALRDQGAAGVLGQLRLTARRPGGGEAAGA